MAKKKLHSTKKKGCTQCGSTTQDLRFGWCYPCFSKAQNKRKKK